MRNVKRSEIGIPYEDQYRAWNTWKQATHFDRAGPNSVFLEDLFDNLTGITGFVMKRMVTPEQADRVRSLVGPYGSVFAKLMVEKYSKEPDTSQG